MNQYGQAFRSIRLIKGIELSQAALDNNMDERTLRRIEAGETAVISPRFDQLLEYYQTPEKVFFKLVKKNAPSQNIVKSIKGNQTVVNQNQVSSVPDERDKRIVELEAQNQQLLENDRFQKNLIEQLMNK